MYTGHALHSASSRRFAPRVVRFLPCGPGRVRGRRGGPPASAALGGWPVQGCRSRCHKRSRSCHVSAQPEASCALRVCSVLRRLHASGRARANDRRRISQERSHRDSPRGARASAPRFALAELPMTVTGGATSEAGAEGPRRRAPREWFPRHADGGGRRSPRRRRPTVRRGAKERPGACKRHDHPLRRLGRGPDY